MISRHLNLLDILDKKKSILLLGARGTGKTALLKETIRHLPHVISIDLLRGRAYQRYTVDPSIFGDEIRQAITRQPGKWTVAVDEVQKVPTLLDEIHSLIEEFRGALTFLLTGSSARKLKRGGANLLAGRALTKYLHPLSSLELELDLDRALLLGTLPGVYFDEHLAIGTLESYVSTYLREEIQEESLVRGIDRFARFLDLAAQLNGEPVNFSKLGKQSGVAGKTALDYYSILCDTLIARQISGWSHSIKKQLLQAPKFYLFDCGVLNALQGMLRAELKPSSFMYGRLFETLVVQELCRANDYLDLGLRFHYWRDKHGAEVDLLISRNATQPLLGIEIKSHPKPDAEDCGGFRSFIADYPDVPRYCFCTTPRAYQRGGIQFLPWNEGVKDLANMVAK